MKKLIDIIELTCRLANERVEELAQDENSYDELYLESEAQIKYTELGQEKFNHYYDYYKKVIEECEVNFTEQFVAMKGGIKHYAVDVDIVTDNGEIVSISDYTFDNLKDAKDFYEKLKSDEKIIGSYFDDTLQEKKGKFEIDNIQLLRIFNNGEFDSGWEKIERIFE